MTGEQGSTDGRADAVGGHDQVGVQVTGAGGDPGAPGRAAYDEVGRAIRAQAVQLLAASGSADPERDAWTLIAWMEGTVFYALAGAGSAVSPALDVLRDQLGRLLATMIGVRHDRRR